jgi:hypothetical protein
MGWRCKSPRRYSLPVVQTPDPRREAQIFNENVQMHRNRLNGCFPLPEMPHRAGWIAETAANG